MKKITFHLLLFFIMTSCNMQKERDILYQSDEFTVFKNKVIQGNNRAEVISPTKIKSNYKSPASDQFSRLITFKVSINEKDNELPVGQNHWLVIDQEHESPLITFGKGELPVPENPGTSLPINYDYTFRIDLSPVLQQFQEKGYYEAYDGSRVYQSEFKGFYIAGGSDPLSWDFVNLENKGLKLQPTADEHIFELTVRFNPYDAADFEEKTWELSENLENRPKFTSEQPIVDALFNLSMEEAIKNIEADSTFRTGAKWGGVWTRDISYSIVLAFAYHEPEVAKISLRKKVKRNRIIQDTGSGGAWPVSSDRTTWCLAAWEIYKVTGDEAWLDEIYPIIKNTLEDDFKTIYDQKLGLYSGESSFLDWREQTYPKWMDNPDIYVSQNLGTNVVHYQAHQILAEIAKIKGAPFEAYQKTANTIKQNINEHFWMKDKGYYAQYLYGRDQLILSPRFEALGESLAILFDVADEDQAKSIMAKSPVTAFGVTCIYPQIPGIPPYHNDAIWPFVQSFWNWAAAKVGNEAVLNQGLASVFRAASLFLTNYENMVAGSGDFMGTEINSDRMLWSMAGNLAMVHRVLMGMEFTTDGLYLNPVVPKNYGGKKTLSNYKYRQTRLNIEVNGYGNTIKKVTIDGKKAETAFIPQNWTGEHVIVIEMSNNDFQENVINMVENHFSPPTVTATKETARIKWEKKEDAESYRVYKNGKFIKSTKATQFDVEDELYAVYQVSAVDSKGYEGFACEPVVFPWKEIIVEIEKFAPMADLPYTNYRGKGFVEISLTQNREILLPIEIESAGIYLVDFRYSNGSGPWNTDNKCAIRSLSVNGIYQGVIVFPQRGSNEWSDWNFTNARTVKLNQGKNNIALHFEEWNNNMNVDVNKAMLDEIRFIKISDD